MNELIKVNTDTLTVSARDLHEALKIETRFNDWFRRMTEYGFTEGVDFYSNLSKTNETGGRPATDYQITVDMAKEICMIQRTEIGKKVRQYFLTLEKAWNTPEQIMARALKIADSTITSLRFENKELTGKVEQLSVDNERMKPKEIFSDAVTASDSAILVRDLAKMIKQNGVDIGEKRLYKWLRNNGYICHNSRTPTQKAMERGLFEVEVKTVERTGRPPIETITTKVTGKGQIYFINKILTEKPSDHYQLSLA